MRPLVYAIRIIDWQDVEAHRDEGVSEDAGQQGHREELSKHVIY